MREAGEEVTEGSIQVSQVFKLNLGPHLQHRQQTQLSLTAKIHQMQQLPVTNMYIRLKNII